MTETEPTEPTVTCCVCGGGPVTYRNFREQPFCWPCADCQCGENPCVRTGINDPAVSAEVEASDPTQCSGEEGFCPEHGFHRHSLKQPGRTIADAFGIPLHLIDSAQPAEHCGHILRGITDDAHWTECVLRPGHQGSHANGEGARWIEKPTAGYCPHCGRGGAGPTAPPTQSALDLIRTSIQVREAKAADELEAGHHRVSDQHYAVAAGLRIAEAHILANPNTELDDTRGRARKDAASSRESERQLQQQIDQQAQVIDRLRDQCRAMLDVQGRCPACRGESLFLGDGGYVTCSRSDYPDPDAASKALELRETPGA